jgi:hypothetical protein
MQQISELVGVQDRRHFRIPPVVVGWTGPSRCVSLRLVYGIQPSADANQSANAGTETGPTATPIAHNPATRTPGEPSVSEQSRTGRFLAQTLDQAVDDCPQFRSRSVTELCQPGVLYYRDEDIDPMRRHGQQHEIANADITGVTNEA